MDSIHAEVAELVDALASGASGRKPVEVQVLSSVPFIYAASQPVCVFFIPGSLFLTSSRCAGIIIGSLFPVKDRRDYTSSLYQLR